jgi:hypothetical protein
MRLALLLGAEIIHVHPITGRLTPAHYRSFQTGRYREASF